jgi:catechol 2,3-dioxygenase-like lactoylglutathione lyase family enzyme
VFDQEALMLGNRTVIAFVPTLNADRARTFYAETLGLEFLRDDGFALLFKAGANLLRVARVPSHTPAGFTILGWDVPDVEAAVRDLNERGLKMERFPGMPHDELGIWTAPNGDQVAWFKDPDGNILSLSRH